MSTKKEEKARGEEKMESTENVNLCERCGQHTGETNSRYSYGSPFSDFPNCGDWVCHWCEESLEREFRAPWLDEESGDSGRTG